jgi:ankyrin repeat protein
MYATIAYDHACRSARSNAYRDSVAWLSAQPRYIRELSARKYVEGNLGNLMKCALSAGVSADALCHGGGTLLLLAAQKGSNEAGAVLLQGGANISMADARGWTALHVASYFGHERFVNLLLGAGALLEARTLCGGTPLITASTGGRARVCELLLKAGASIEAEDDEGKAAMILAAHDGLTSVVSVLAAAGANLYPSGLRSALHIAAQKGHADTVCALLAAGAAVNGVTPPGPTFVDANRAHAICGNQGSYSALHLAAGHGAAAVVRVLVENGADLDAKDGMQRTALHMSFPAHIGDMEVLSALLELGADVSARDVYQDTPLHCAVLMRSNSRGIITALLAGGAPLEAVNCDGHTALSAAAASGQLGALCSLLQRGASADPQHNYVRNTPLMTAIQSRQPLIVQALLPVSNLAICRRDGTNAFHISVSSGNEEAFRLLLPLMADVDVAGMAGVGDDAAHTPHDHRHAALHIAAGKGLLWAIKALLRAGACRTVRDAQEETPLHHAAKNGELSCLVAVLGRAGHYKLLPECVDSRDALGQTALHKAASRGFISCCGPLLAAGASRLATDKQGRTPCALAMACGQDITLVTLLGRSSAAGRALGTVCDSCGKRDGDDGVRLSSCSGCLSVRYCSRACLLASWPSHKAECRARKLAHTANVTSLPALH